jgi:catechol 2,3-dioxygenase-like lactoylglutathione lyase family enzyme
MNVMKWMKTASAALLVMQLGLLGATSVQAQSASAPDAATPAAATSSAGQVTGIEFVGRMVADLDKSVAFYKSLGFTQDMKANPAWRTDEVTNKIYGIKGVQTRMAKMAINSNASGKVFTLYLREMKGIERRDLSKHMPWDPGVTHFGLVVPDANALWAQLKANGTLRARSWDDKLVAPPGQTKGMLAYMTDPDGLDIEIIDQRPAVPAQNGNPGRPAFKPGLSHVGLVILDADKARGFYETLFGGQLVNKESPWMKGDFYDSAVGGHGNILRFFNLSFPEAVAPASRLNLELVEFQNRKKPVEPANPYDIGTAYVGFEVKNLDAFLPRVKAAGAKVVSDGIVTMKVGTRVVMIRDPDTGAFIELFEQPASLPR